MPSSLNRPGSMAAVYAAGIVYMCGGIMAGSGTSNKCMKYNIAAEEFSEMADMPQGVKYRVGNPGRMRMFYNPVVSLEDGIKRALADG